MFSERTRLAVRHFSGELAYTAAQIPRKLAGTAAVREPLPIRMLAGTGKSVALTFDDGPSHQTPALTELLNSFQARATFFVCGTNVRRYPGIVRELADAGHEVGNHTYTHRQLYFSSAVRMRTELYQTQEVIESVGLACPTLFRPPFGSRWFGLGQIEKEMGLSRVLWTEDALDWKLNRAGIAQRVLATARPGSIVCLHDARGLLPHPEIIETIEAVRVILQTLTDKGFRFGTVSELLRNAQERG